MDGNPFDDVGNPFELDDPPSTPSKSTSSPPVPFVATAVSPRLRRRSPSVTIGGHDRRHSTPLPVSLSPPSVSKTELTLGQEGNNSQKEGGDGLTNRARVSQSWASARAAQRATARLSLPTPPRPSPSMTSSSSSSSSSTSTSTPSPLTTDILGNPKPSPALLRVKSDPEISPMKQQKSSIFLRIGRAGKGSDTTKKNKSKKMKHPPALKVDEASAETLRETQSDEGPKTMNRLNGMDCSSSDVTTTTTTNTPTPHVRRYSDQISLQQQGKTTDSAVPSLVELRNNYRLVKREEVVSDHGLKHPPLNLPQSPGGAMTLTNGGDDQMKKLSKMAHRTADFANDAAQRFKVAASNATILAEEIVAAVTQSPKARTETISSPRPNGTSIASHRASWSPSHPPRRNDDDSASMPDNAHESESEPSSGDEPSTVKVAAIREAVHDYVHNKPAPQQITSSTKRETVPSSVSSSSPVLLQPGATQVTIQSVTDAQGMPHPLVTYTTTPTTSVGPSLPSSPLLQPFMPPLPLAPSTNLEPSSSLSSVTVTSHTIERFEQAIDKLHQLCPPALSLPGHEELEKPEDDDDDDEDDFDELLFHMDPSLDGVSTTSSLSHHSTDKSFLSQGGNNGGRSSSAPSSPRLHARLRHDDQDSALKRQSLSKARASERLKKLFQSVKKDRETVVAEGLDPVPFTLASSSAADAAAPTLPGPREAGLQDVLQRMQQTIQNAHLHQLDLIQDLITTLDHDAIDNKDQQRDEHEAVLTTMKVLLRDDHRRAQIHQKKLQARWTSTHQSIQDAIVKLFREMMKEQRKTRQFIRECLRNLERQRIEDQQKQQMSFSVLTDAIQALGGLMSEQRRETELFRVAFHEQHQTHHRLGEVNDQRFTLLREQHRLAEAKWKEDLSAMQTNLETKERQLSAIHAIFQSNQAFQSYFDQLTRKTRSSQPVGSKTRSPLTLSPVSSSSSSDPQIRRSSASLHRRKH